MTRTITALFDHRHDAEAAEARLTAADVDAGHIRIHDKSSDGYSETGHSSHREPGLWGTIKNAFLPDEDRHTYEEGLRRGGVLLTVDVDDDQVDAALHVLEESDSVDLDDRAQQWRSSGWAGSPGAATGTDAGGSFAGGHASATTTDGRDDGFAEGAFGEGAFADDDRFVYGTRDSDRGGDRDGSRGGSRVRSYTTDTPVQEQLRRRESRIAHDDVPDTSPRSAGNIDRD